MNWEDYVQMEFDMAIGYCLEKAIPAGYIIADVLDCENQSLDCPGCPYKKTAGDSVVTGDSNGQ